MPLEFSTRHRRCHPERKAHRVQELACMPNVRSALDRRGFALVCRLQPMRLVPAAGPCRHREPAAGARSERRGPSAATAARKRRRPRHPAFQPSSSASPARWLYRRPPLRRPKLTAKVSRLSPDAAPRILEVAVSETTVHPGDTVSGSVVTSSNVASVQARIGGYAMTLANTGVGRFALTYTVAPLPWFIRGTFNMRVIAKNTRGDTVERTIPLTVR